ncbi:hypothetical protein M422DRAFT_267698 [Sphaerobolus stellatus SS14]|uniref:DUF6533 domain-containing protein n=1 Tax=Sphaerobolus stellatus (strain SS14) TaxID=990650 RepID=A0A0C9UPA5_SPHS4|nr:hypothetical protein M422DRAFT_267698 [Sphaerobolus stellatus SS14]
MSNPSVAELKTEYFSLTIFNYAYLAALTLIVYDTILTLEEEVTVIWKKKFGLGSILYLLARYCTTVQSVFEVTSDLVTFEGRVSVKVYHFRSPTAFGDLKTNPFPVESVDSILALISDGVVMSITTYFAWREAKQAHDAFGSSRRSLTVIFLQQGVIRFIIIFLWSLELSIEQKVLDPWLAGFDAGLQNAISAILICRFMLQLRRFNSREQTVPSFHFASNSGIRGQLHRINETITEQFGNSEMYHDSDIEDNAAVSEGPSGSAGLATEVQITAEGSPWAMNRRESLQGSLEARTP